MSVEVACNLITYTYVIKRRKLVCLEKNIKCSKSHKKHCWNMTSKNYHEICVCVHVILLHTF